MSDALNPTVLDNSDQRVQDLEALEKELREFSGGLVYDQARIIENTQDGFRQGVEGFYKAGLGLILMDRHEGATTLSQILERYFPGINRRSAERYMQFARAASKLPNFRHFCLERGGYSKGLTMLQAFTEEEIQDFEVSGELRGYSKDEIDQMSVATMRRALLKAKEAQQKAVDKATEKLNKENADLKEKNEVLEATLMEPDVQAAFKIIRDIEKKLMESAALIRKISPALMEREETVRTLIFGTCDMINRQVTQFEYAALEALKRVQAAEEEEE